MTIKAIETNLYRTKKAQEKVLDCF